MNNTVDINDSFHVHVYAIEIDPYRPNLILGLFILTF